MPYTYFTTATIAPHNVLAGDSVEFTLRLVVSAAFSARRARIILDLPAYLGYDRPSTFDHEDGGYTYVLCSNPEIAYKKRPWDMEIGDFPSRSRSSFKRMAQRLFVLDLDGPARAGDEIVFKWGYVRHGMGVGTRVTSLVLTHPFINTVHVRYFLDDTRGLPDYARSFKGYRRPTPDEEIALSFRVLPREPEQIRFIRRSARAGIVVLDRFWNACPLRTLRKCGRASRPTRPNRFGVLEVDAPDVAVSSDTLPVRVTPDCRNVMAGLSIFFGDLHSHSAYSNDCIEREKMTLTPADTFAFGRDVACLDFMAVTDHHQPWDSERNKIGELNYERTVAAAGAITADGRFAAFPGFEFRGAWKNDRQRGDTAVILNEVVPYDVIDQPTQTDIRALWHDLHGRDYLTIPHFHNGGRLPRNQWYECPYPGVEPYLEIFSCHGSYEDFDVQQRDIGEMRRWRYDGDTKSWVRNRTDRNARYFLEKGYRYGFGANSDGHKGNPGTNGLTAVFAPELTRDAVVAAIRQRHLYGTTNARIRLVMTVNDALMGSVIPRGDGAQLHLDIAGEAPLKAVDVLVNAGLYRRYLPAAARFTADLTIAADAVHNIYVRVIQMDDHMAWSSPVWLVDGRDRGAPTPPP